MINASPRIAAIGSATVGNSGISKSPLLKQNVTCDLLHLYSWRNKLQCRIYAALNMNPDHYRTCGCLYDHCTNRVSLKSQSKVCAITDSPDCNSSYFGCNRIDISTICTVVSFQGSKHVGIVNAHESAASHLSGSVGPPFGLTFVRNMLLQFLRLQAVAIGIAAVPE